MSNSKYYVDLSKFSLEKLGHRIKNTRLPPGHRILQENIDERFSCISKNGIENLEQLQKALKTKSDVQSFADDTGLPLDYLTVLRREVNSFQPKPFNLKDFPGVDPEAVVKLTQIGIKNTKQLFPNVLTPQDRRLIAEQIQIQFDEILELTKLTDVARLKWVGPKFARLLIESDYDTVEKVANSNYEELYQALVRTNERSNIYKGKFGMEDLKSWVNVAVQDVPQVIKY